MKLGYRMNLSGGYIPQYEDKDGKWNDILLKHLGSENTALHRLALRLGKQIRWGDTQYYFKPNVGQKKEDMALFFQTEMLVCAFLGGAKIVWSNETRVVEF